MYFWSPLTFNQVTLDNFGTSWEYQKRALNPALSLKSLFDGVSWTNAIRVYSGILLQLSLGYILAVLALVLNPNTLSSLTFSRLWEVTCWLLHVMKFLALAVMFMDIVTSDVDTTFSGRSRIRTIALGAPTYNDIRIGANYFPFDAERDFLRLRVYQVDYHPNDYGYGVCPILKMVAKGSPAHAYRTCANIEILETYWLGWTSAPLDFEDKIHLNETYFECHWWANLGSYIATRWHGFWRSYRIAVVLNQASLRWQLAWHIHLHTNRQITIRLPF